MTSPDERLGADDRRHPFARSGLKIPQPIPKVLGLHVICVSAEGLVDPAIIRRPFARMASPAKRRYVLVSNARSFQAAAQGRLIVLGVVTRVRNRPHIDDPLDSVRLQQRHEFVEGAGRMPDRVYTRLLHPGSARSASRARPSRPTRAPMD